MQNLYDDLKELLSQHEPYIIDGKLNKPKIEDVDYAVSDTDKKINHKFYSMK